MSEFTQEASVLLQRLVQERKIDGLQPTAVRTHPLYAATFKGIKSSTFASEVRRLRVEYGFNAAMNGMLSLTMYILLIFEISNKNSF